MDYKTKQKLFDRNQKIIDKLMDEINKKCPDGIDLIGIAGSFCSGMFYEKSDLDLLIIGNDNYKEDISNCFIYDGIGHDIYVSSWNRLEEMSKYKNNFVTKLKDLDIIYTKDDSVIQRYKTLQNILDINMNDNDKINNTIGSYLGNIIQLNNDLINSNNFYTILGKIMNYLENIIYLINKKYVVGGTKNIPQEISNMEILPNNFLENYLNIPESNDKEEIIKYVENIIKSLINYFNDNKIEIITPIKEQAKENIKKDLTKQDLIGVYEELYSNYNNKLYHAKDTNNKFLSLRTMIDAQGFFDELYETYNIEKIELVDKYDPNNLMKNAEEFSKCLEKIKELYKKFNIEIEEYKSLDELYRIKEEDIPELNIFMVCDKLNNESILDLSNDYYIRKCRPSELELWKSFPFDKEEEARKYNSFMTDYFNEVYGNDIDKFFDSCLFVCDKNDNPISTCFIWKTYDSINTVHWLKTKKECEGKGIGRALMSYLMENLKEEDYPIYLHTHPSCYKAIGLYSSLGFKIVTNDMVGNRKNDYKESIEYLKSFMTPESYSKLKYVEINDIFKEKEKNIKTNHF